MRPTGAGLIPLIPAPAPRALTRGVYQLPTDYPELCNAPLWTYLVGDSESFAIIDAGVSTTFAATLASSLEYLGVAPEQASVVIATHGHPDHSGGQTTWRKVAPGVELAAPLDDVPWVESFDRQWRMYWDDYPGALDMNSRREFFAGLCTPEPRIDRPLRDGDQISVSGHELEVLQTRGHTWGHCALFDATTGCLFSGDAVQGWGIRRSDSSTMIAPLYLDVDDARMGLRRLLDVSFDFLCPAHIEPMSSAAGEALLRKSLSFIDAAEEVADRLARQQGASPLLTRTLAERLGALVGSEPRVSPQTVPTARAHLYALARQGLLEPAWIGRPQSPRNSDSGELPARRTHG